MMAQQLTANIQKFFDTLCAKIYHELTETEEIRSAKAIQWRYKRQSVIFDLKYLHERLAIGLPSKIVFQRVGPANMSVSIVPNGVYTDGVYISGAPFHVEPLGDYKFRATL